MQTGQHLDFSWWDPSWTSDYTEVSHLVHPAHEEKAFFNGADTRRWDQWNHPYHNCTFDGWQYFKKFWVSRGCRGWEDPGLWQIGWNFQTEMTLTPLNLGQSLLSFSLWTCPTQWDMGDVFGKASPAIPLPFVAVYYKSSCEPGVTTMELLVSFGWYWLLGSA